MFYKALCTNYVKADLLNHYNVVRMGSGFLIKFSKVCVFVFFINVKLHAQKYEIQLKSKNTVPVAECIRKYYG